MTAYESVIGLEVHAQLDTRSKIFCACATTYGAPANSLTCPVCLGHPGALPVLNRRAVRLALRGALALDCAVRRHSTFARKHYFYPDLPKGYQISQYDEPLAEGGAVEIELGETSHRIGLSRLHLEEDAGKSIHDGMPDSERYSYIDLNRAGVPLVEIVSRPEIRTAEEAYLFLQRLRSILRYAGVCDGNMEQGSLRCDANISVRPAGRSELGTRTELKNLNSFRNVQRALEFEIDRQQRVLASGQSVERETVLWDAAAGRTRPMRGKEEAQDYRYFPEPDLPPLAVAPGLFDEAREGLPELPAARKRRFVASYALAPHEAHLLTLERALADYYEEVVRCGGAPRAAANFVLNDLLREQKRAKRTEDEIPLPAMHLAALLRLVERGTVSVTMARQELFPRIYRSGVAPEELMRTQDVERLDDEATLRAAVREVLTTHPRQLEQLRAGKEGLLGYFVGLVMRKTAGRANPSRVRVLLEEETR